MLSKYYYFINNTGTITKKIWEASRIDWKRYNSDNYFEHFEEAFDYITNDYGTRPKTTTIPEILS